MSSDRSSLELATVLRWARSGHEWDKVYRFIFLRPGDFFTIPERRSWSLAHQVVYHGDIDLLKRILALFSDDQIDIRTLSNDNKSLLDVARERRVAYSAMFTYIEHLFLQDDLIQAAKKSNWRLVSDILEKNPGLTNEKPPYSTYFLLHYVIQNGTKEILQDLLKRFQFQTNVLSADNETPIDMATRLRKDDMCAILDLKTRDQSQTNPVRFRPPPSPPHYINISNGKQTSTASSTSTACPYPITDGFPCLGFGNIVLDLNTNGSFTLSTPNPLTSVNTELKQQERSTIATTENVGTTQITVDQKHETNSESTPVTPGLNAQSLKNFTCSLTQEIFVDPVIANDGQTYERDAITEWVNLYHCSPTTGAPMDAKFVDNTELKQMIQSMKKMS